MLTKGPLRTYTGYLYQLIHIPVLPEEQWNGISEEKIKLQHITNTERKIEEV